MLLVPGVHAASDIELPFGEVRHEVHIDVLGPVRQQKHEVVADWIKLSIICVVQQYNSISKSDII